MKRTAIIDNSKEYIRSVIESWLLDGRKLNDKIVPSSELAAMLNISLSELNKEIRYVQKVLGVAVDDTIASEVFYDWVKDNKILRDSQIEELTKQQQLGLQGFYSVYESIQKLRKGEASNIDPRDIALLKEAVKLLEISNKDIQELDKMRGELIQNYIALLQPKEQAINSSTTVNIDNKTQINMLEQVIDKFNERNQLQKTSGDRSEDA